MSPYPTAGGDSGGGGSLYFAKSADFTVDPAEIGDATDVEYWIDISGGDVTVTMPEPSVFGSPRMITLFCRDDDGMVPANAIKIFMPTAGLVVPRVVTPGGVLYPNPALPLSTTMGSKAEFFAPGSGSLWRSG